MKPELDEPRFNPGRDAGQRKDPMPPEAQAAQTNETIPPPAPANGKAVEAMSGPGLTGEAAAAPVTGEMLPPPAKPDASAMKRLKAIEKLGRQIADAQAAVARQETACAAAKSRLEDERETLSERNVELRDLQDDLNKIALGGFSERLEFGKPKGGGKNKAAAHAEAKGAPAPTDDAWRSVTLEQLGITKPRVVKALTEREPSLGTLGALADWVKVKGDWWSKDIKGIGQAAAQDITDAMDKFWFSQGIPKPAAAQPPTETAPEDVVPLAAAMGKPKKKAKPKAVSKRATKVKRSR